MTDAYDLIAEARSRFGGLSEAEEKLLRCAESGDVAYGGPSEKDEDPANDPAKADGWSKERTIRALLVRWLCVGSEASKHVDPPGIRVYAARIGDAPNEKDLDLLAARVHFSLYFASCSFAVPLRLMDARLKGFSLPANRIPGLNADRLLADGAVFMNDGFYAVGGVRLLGGEIKGSFDCAGGIFGDSLSADRVRVGGSIFFNKEFSAAGGVHLSGAEIGGDLDCRRGTFVKNGGDALSGDGMKVTGAVFFGKFNADGAVDLSGAEINGQLCIREAQFADASSVKLEMATVKRGFSWTGLSPNSPVRLYLQETRADTATEWPTSLVIRRVPRSALKRLWKRANLRDAPTRRRGLGSTRTRRARGHPSSAAQSSN